MTNYTRHQIKQFYRKFSSRKFDQDDVVHFITATRDYNGRVSILKEIGDFIAHPKQKERGVIHEGIKEIEVPFDQCIEASVIGSEEHTEELFFKGIGTIEDLAENLTSILLKADVRNVTFTTDSPNFREFVYCIIFILSAYRLKVKSKLPGVNNLAVNKIIKLDVFYSRDLNLQAQMESSQFGSCYAILPILRLQNIQPNSPSILPPYPERKLSNHIVRRMDNGDVAAFSYEDDPGESPVKVASLENIVVWPLSNSPRNGI